MEANTTACRGLQHHSLPIPNRCCCCYPVPFSLRLLLLLSLRRSAAAAARVLLCCLLLRCCFAALALEPLGLSQRHLVDRLLGHVDAADAALEQVAADVLLLQACTGTHQGQDIN
eukprot:GHRQ01034071.1.p1 GENE.GHRQ01034071.1~~GHRQ01034071.1.p1  ORF type:complete len:115 (+),score=15.40 GHRQ01034071.1:302-646(+)